VLNLDPANIRGVVYLDRLKLGVMDGIWIHFIDGTSRLYEGAELDLARSAAKNRFPTKPGLNRVSDQLLPKES
jgi:hypothetical protein